MNAMLVNIDFTTAGMNVGNGPRRDMDSDPECPNLKALYIHRLSMLMFPIPPLVW